MSISIGRNDDLFNQQALKSKRSTSASQPPFRTVPDTNNAPQPVLKAVPDTNNAPQPDLKAVPDTNNAPVQPTVAAQGVVDSRSLPSVRTSIGNIEEMDLLRGVFSAMQSRMMHGAVSPSEGTSAASSTTAGPSDAASVFEEIHMNSGSHEEANTQFKFTPDIIQFMKVVQEFLYRDHVNMERISQLERENQSLRAENVQWEQALQNSFASHATIMAAYTKSQDELRELHSNFRKVDAKAKRYADMIEQCHVDIDRLQYELREATQMGIEIVTESNAAVDAAEKTVVELRAENRELRQFYENCLHETTLLQSKLDQAQKDHQAVVTAILEERARESPKEQPPVYSRHPPPPAGPDKSASKAPPVWNRFEY